MRIVFLTNSYTATALPYLRKLVSADKEIVGIFVVASQAKYWRRMRQLPALLRKYGLLMILRRLLSNLCRKLRFSTRRLFKKPCFDSDCLSVEELAVFHSLKLVKTRDINAAASLDKLKGLAPEIVFVCTLNQILAKDALAIARSTCINIHAGRLPQYRGPASNFWVLHNQEKTTAVTFHYLSEKVDGGDIILQKEMAILPGDSEQSLDRRLAQLGSGCILKVISDIENNTVKRYPQDQAGSYFSQPSARQRKGLVRKTGRLARRSLGVGGPFLNLWTDAVRQEAVELCWEARGRLLEIGCGQGVFLADLARINEAVEIHAVDNNQARLTQAQALCAASAPQRIKFKQAEAVKLPWPDEFFDTVVCINTLVNMEGLGLVEQVLGQVQRVSKRGARIIFDLRNRQNPLLRLKYKLAPYYDSTIRLQQLPLNTYYRATLEEVLDKLAIKIVREKYLAFPYNRFSPVIMVEAQRC